MRASDRAYEALRDEIIEGDLAPGVVLTEVELASRIGVSRTPIREALSRLGADGLVAQGSRGAVVTDIAPDDVEHLFEVRIALETRQARAAAARCEPDVFLAFAEVFEAAVPDLEAGRAPLREHLRLIRRFDNALDEACGNPYLVDSLRALRIHLARIRHRARRDPSRIGQAAREHAIISRAIASRDAELAAHATHVHLASVLTHLTGSI